MSNSLRERALRLLARREHSLTELARKLAPHAESAEEIDALLDDLTARGLLSDERYVAMRLNARGARFGNARLAYELRTQGITEETIDSALSESDNERSRARQVWEKKFGNPPQDATERARQMRFLINRGFSGETIRHVLRGDFEDD